MLKPRVINTSFAVAGVCALLLLGMALTWRAADSTQDEGLLLEYPELILHGEVPFKNFQSSYGPGAYLPLAATYAVFGPGQSAERAMGVAYRLAIVLAVVALLLPVGTRTAVVGASLATLSIVTGEAPIAYGWYFALACILWGLWFARAGLARDGPREAGLRWLVSGLLVGAAISARPDIGVAAVLCSLLLIFGAPRLSWLAFGAGLLAGVSPLLWNIAAAGWSRFWAFAVEARFHQLPVSGYPFLHGIGFVAIVVCADLVVLNAAIRERLAKGANPLTRTWLALAALGVLLLPQLVQRADRGHFAFVAPVTVGLLPWASTRGRTSRVLALSIPVLCVLAIAIEAIGFSNAGYQVRNDGRRFLLPFPQQAHSLGLVLGWLDRHVASGRQLFVGPSDLRYALDADTTVYYLEPDLRPATFYLELGPGDNTAVFTRLTIDALRRSDVLVLEDDTGLRSQIWPEAPIGSSAPNGLISHDFRPVLRAFPYSVWVRASTAPAPGAVAASARSSA